AIGHPRLVGCVVDRRRRPGQGAGQPGGGDGHADHGGGETAPPPQGAAGKGRDAAGEQIHGELLGDGPAPWGTEPGGSIVGGRGPAGGGVGLGRGPAWGGVRPGAGSGLGRGPAWGGVRPGAGAGRGRGPAWGGGPPGAGAG